MSAGFSAAVVDASVWVSIFIPEDLHHEPSRRWLQEYSTSGNTIVAPALLLAEIAGAVARRVGDSELALRSTQRALRVRGLRLVPLNRQLGLLAATIAAAGRLRGADTMYLAAAQQLAIPSISWDREQLAYAACSGTSYTPQALL